MLAAITDLRYRVRPDILTYLSIVLGFLAAGAAIGLLIASGKPVLIALSLGCILSLVLLNSPGIAVWLVLIGTLLVSGPLLFNFPQIDKLSWLFAMLGFFLMVASVLYAGLQRPDGRGPVPFFIVLMVAMLFYSIASFAWSIDDLSFGTNGLKRYFQFFGLAFAIAVIGFSEKTVKAWVVFLLLLALIQLPYVAYQRFVMVLSQGFDMDVVVGFFELHRSGRGNSGSLGFLQVVAFAGLLAAWREKLLGLPMLVVLSGIVITPVFLADLNVVLLMVPMVLVIVFIDLIRSRPLVFLTAVSGVLFAIVLVGAGLVIWQQNNLNPASQATTLDRKIQDLIDYNYGSKGYTGNADLNRTTVYPYWWRQHSITDPLALVIGHGVGSTGSSESARSILSNKYQRLSINLTSAALLLWEQGLFGFVLYMSSLALAWRASRRLASGLAPPGFQRALARTLSVAVACTGLYMFYNNSMMGIPSQQVMGAMALGLVAWQYRRFGLMPAGASSATPVAPMPTPAAPSARPIVSPVAPAMPARPALPKLES